MAFLCMPGECQPVPPRIAPHLGPTISQDWQAASFRRVLQGFKEAVRAADRPPCLKISSRSELIRHRPKRLRKKALSPTDTNSFATGALARGGETSQSTAPEASLHASVAQFTHATSNAALEHPTLAPLAKQPLTNVRKLGAYPADVLSATQGRLRLHF